MLSGRPQIIWKITSKFIPCLEIGRFTSDTLLPSPNGKSNRRPFDFSLPHFPLNFNVPFVVKDSIINILVENFSVHFISETSSEPQLAAIIARCLFRKISEHSRQYRISNSLIYLQTPIASFSSHASIYLRVFINSPSSRPFAMDPESGQLHQKKRKWRWIKKEEWVGTDTKFKI